MGTNDFSKNPTLFRESRGAVTGEPHQKNALRDPQHPNEQLRAQAADNPKHNRIQKEPRPVSGLHDNFLPSNERTDC